MKWEEDKLFIKIVEVNDIWYFIGNNFFICDSLDAQIFNIISAIK